MTLERILKASVASMITGHHAPHCWRAFVAGQGYVNDGSAVYDRRDYLRQLKRTATSEIENIGWAPGYAEPGYDQPKRGVVMANWNHLPKELDSILDRAGYTVEWSDEWTECSDCGKALRTSPDSYGWRPSYTVTSDGEVVCRVCEAPTTSPVESNERTF